MYATSEAAACRPAALLLRLLVVLLLMAECSQAGDLATASDASSCGSVNAVTAVTECAKSNRPFVQCATDGNPGATRQCTCLEQNSDMQRCLHPCLDHIYERLCRRQWQPPSSKFLQYGPHYQLLAGIDGVYLLNMQRRRDRLQRFFHNTSLTHDDVHVLSAFDGQQLSWTSSLDKIFSNANFGRARGMVGKCLSHFLLWRHIATTEDQFHLILEDDTRFPTSFVDKWNQQTQHAFPPDAKVVFLCGLQQQNRDAYFQKGTVDRVSKHFVKHLPTTLFTRDFDPSIEKGSKDDPTPAFHYRTCGYILSSQGAKDLVNFIADHGFVQPPGVMLMKLMRQWKDVYAAYPLPIIEANENFELAHGIDSDVEFDTTPVRDQPYNAIESHQQPSTQASGQQPQPQQHQQHQQHCHGDSCGSEQHNSTYTQTAQHLADQNKQHHQHQNEERHHENEHHQHQNEQQQQHQTEQQHQHQNEHQHHQNEQQQQQQQHMGASFEPIGAPVFVINLNDSTHRMATFHERAVKARLSYSRFAATDGEILDMPKAKERGLFGKDFDEEDKHQAGRALSHLLLWEHIAGRSEPFALVFEDDVVVEQTFRSQFMQLLSKAPTDWGIILFSCSPECMEAGRDFVPISDRTESCKPTGVAYLIKRAVAAHLLRTSLPVKADATQMLAAAGVGQQDHALGVYCYTGGIVYESEQPLL